MNRHRRPLRHRRGDRGFGLVDVVVGLFLVAIGATTVAWLLADAARESAPSDRSATFAALAADSFTTDVRGGERIEVIRSSGGTVTSIDVVSTAARIRWQIRRGDLSRHDRARPSARVMVTDVDTGGRFTLLTATGDPVDAADADEVRWCTRLVRIEVADVDAEWAIDRTVGLRAGPEGVPCR